jgi:hypothetical protein
VTEVKFNVISIGAYAVLPSLHCVTDLSFWATTNTIHLLPPFVFFVLRERNEKNSGRGGGKQAFQSTGNTHHGTADSVCFVSL